jgi:hypothetical protein
MAFPSFLLRIPLLVAFLALDEVSGSTSLLGGLKAKFVL